MTLALTPQTVPVGLSPLDRTFSDDGARLRRLLWEATDFSNSISMYRPVENILCALRDALAEAEEENWDSYGASSGDPKAFAYALMLLLQLPRTIPSPPEVTIDSEGDIALEWDYGPRRIISIRVSGDGTINYAGLLGHTTFHGVEFSRDGVPETVAKAIERVVFTPTFNQTG